MKLPLYSLLLSGFLLISSISWCELGYYYYIFYYSCWEWPELITSEGDNNLTRIMVVSDTHIMGRVKSQRLDKVRREWQMERAFSISNKILKPNLVIFLGDLFDEASFSGTEAFETASQDFERIFLIDELYQKRIVIPGNHDIGFHDQMIYYPYVWDRFNEKYHTTSSIENIRFNDLNIITTNSMSFYDDTCPYCSHSRAMTNRIARDLEKQYELSLSAYSPPILLTHIPLFRHNDTKCDYPNSIREVVQKGNIEGKGVLHKTSSQYLLRKLRPRLVLSGHTHMLCTTVHEVEYADRTKNIFVEELTISSYNHKFAEMKPGFLIISANSSHLATKKCDLVEEWVIISIYAVTVILICSILTLPHRSRISTDIS